MSRPRSVFFCRDCGGESLRWEGRCPACGAWNTLVEAPAGGLGRPARAASPRRVEPLESGPTAPADRIPVGMGELDRVLGGGLVPGSLLLLGGAPGVGKSTLLLQAAGSVAAGGREVLYASGEESREQVRLRADRLGAETGRVSFLATRSVEEIAATAGETGPALLCVDSIQTLASADAASAAGTVSQVRACSATLQELAKSTGMATVLVGHVTKDGSLAGPRTLEHLVDVVLHVEGGRSGEYRIVRGGKNRFGASDELAVFRMTGQGLEPVPDPTSLFLEDRPVSVSGSAVAIPLHGSRPLLAEVQALTARSRYPTPQRVATGLPPRRLAILLAVLERRGGIDLGDADVFVSVVGGLRLADPASDLAVAAAIASARWDRPLPEGTAFAAEIGLGGELRTVSRPEARIAAARRAGLDTIVLAAGHGSALAGEPGVVLAGRLGDVLRLGERDG